MNAELPEIPWDDSSLASSERASSGRRLALATRLTDPRHPLLARVIVNRIWMHHFGRGLVATPADFGALGSPPTHPELLDYLASEFIQSGWSVKHMHRLLMQSTAYRQALRVDSAQDEADPDNLLYGGARLRRLDAETFRDTILMVCGKLDRQSGGPPVPVMADSVGRWVLGIENIKDGRTGERLTLKGQEFRRSIYVEVRRSRPLSVLDSFDWPRMAPNCDMRRDSTVATQSLMLLNSDLIVSCADALSERIRRDVGEDVRHQIVQLWKLAYGRNPTAEEIETAQQFVSDQQTHFQNAGPRSEHSPDASTFRPQDSALASLCHMLLSSNEFLYVE